MSLYFSDHENLNQNLINKILEQQHQKPLLISIAGSSASGKTSLISPKVFQLIKKNSQLTPIIINQDNFQLGKAFSQNNTSQYKFDDPKNFDLPGCYQRLTELLTKQKSQLPNFSFQLCKRTDSQTISIKTNTVLIFEGLYAFYDNNLAELANYKIFVQAKFYARLIRRIFRNIYELKRPLTSRALEQIVLEVQPANKNLVSSQQNSADLVIATPYSFLETQQLFNLEKQNPFITPSGNTLWQVEPEPQLSLLIIKTPQKTLSFNLTFAGKNYYQVETSEAVLQALQQLDPHSYI